MDRVQRFPSGNGHLPEELQARAATATGAMGSIYEMFKGPVFGLVYRYAQNRAAAEDLLQDVFVKVFSNMRHVRDAATFPAWVFRIALNTAYSHLRQKRVQTEKLVPLGDLEGRLEEPGTEPVERDLQGPLEAAIRTLAPRLKSVFVLHDVQGYKHEEIALRLGCAVGTSKSQLFKARISPGVSAGQEGGLGRTTMTCRKSMVYISRAIDGDLSERESARLERHLAACGECRVLREDLRRIVRGAARLETPEPSGTVWRNVRARLEAGAIRPPAEGAATVRPSLFGLSRPASNAGRRLAHPVAWPVTDGVWPQEVRRALSGEGTRAKLDEAERYYQQAITSLSQAFAAGKRGLAPEVVELFERNLLVIDATIQACRGAVLAEPDDLEARNYLLAAYTKKVTLLDSALDLQRGDRDAAVGKTII
jgi:RNA polymerase sigma-70 factor (ECF subfamily)